VKILYLCHRIPYPRNKGEKIRAFHQLQAMSARHEVDLFTLVDDPADLEHRAALSKWCRRVAAVPIRPALARLRALPYLFTETPLTLPCFHSTGLRSEVDRAFAAEQYDRIFVYSSAMAQYAPTNGRVPLLIDLVDVDSDKWTQYSASARFPYSAIYRREGRFLARYERSISEKAAVAIVSTEREAGLLRAIAPEARIEVVPNGVNTEFFSPSAVAPENSGPAIVFTGDMSYFPNEDAVGFFASEVLPLIRRAIPGVRFLVVGRNPGPKVLRLQQFEGVTITGFVPDVRTYLAQAQVATAPFLIAAGIQNKILEAMSYGLPVVATKRATQGLSRRVGELVETGETAQELAARVVALLRDSGAARRKGLAGRVRVTEEYRWEAALDSLMHLLEAVIPA